MVEKEIIHKPVTRALVIPNPVSYAEATRRRRSKKHRYTIATIGRWTPIKNFQAFLSLHKRLVDERWPHRAIMVTSYWDERFGIPETVERKDPMDQETLKKFYGSIDLLVVPSHFETFCNVAAEALIHGCSVLVSENVGFAEVLHRAGLGRMVITNFDDPDLVAAAVKTLATTKLSKKERDAVARIVDPQKVHENIIRVLERVVAAKPLK